MNRRLIPSIGAAITALAVLAGPAAAKPHSSQSAVISSIAPAVADRGGTLTITGHGFGGPNVAIRVGHLRADVLSATGSKATFRVPALASPGDTTVRATNPGGHSDSIALNVRFDGLVAPVVDQAAAVSGTIGRDGGALTANGVTLEIPAGALSDEQQITITPLRALTGSPFEGGVIGAEFEPDGLALLKPATLSFPLPSGIQAAEVLGFGFAGGGGDLHLVPHEIEGDRFALEIWHFSGAGGHFGRFVNGVAPWVPGSAETQAEQEIALAKLDCELQRAALPSGPWPACDAFDGRVRQVLFDWYVAAVKPGLQAPQAPSFQVEEAVREWLGWTGRANSLLNDFGSLKADLDEAHDLATKAVAELTKRRLDNCTGTDLRSQLRDVERMADLVVAAAIDLTLTTEKLPDIALLLDACAGIRIEEPTFPQVAARSTANRLSVRPFVGTYTGAQLTNVPLQVSLAVTNAGSDSSGGPLDGQGRFQTNIRPFSSAFNVTLDITVDLGPGALPSLLPGERARYFQPTGITRTRIARARMEAEFQGPSPFRPGGNGRIFVRLAGDDVTARTIGFAIASGPGSIAAATATTDPSGEVSVIFTAFTSLNSTTVVDVTFDDGGNTLSKSLTISTARGITVTVSPASVSVLPGGTVQFSATVLNAANPAVKWVTTGGGSIDLNSGLYTAGSTPGTFLVAAGSVEDPNVSGQATVQILAHTTIAGSYLGTCTSSGSTFPGTARLTIFDFGGTVQFGLFGQAGNECNSGFSTQAGCLWSLTGVGATGGGFNTSVRTCRFGNGEPVGRIAGSVGSGNLTFTTFSSDDGTALEVFQLTKQ